MRQPSNYLSEYFLKMIWPKFSSVFRNPKSKDIYFSDISTFSDYVKKDVLDVNYDDCQSYITNLNTQLITGQIKQSTITKKHKELSALFKFICNGNFHVPPGFENWFTRIELIIPDASISVNKTLSVTEIDSLVGYLCQENNCCFLAFLLAFKQMLRTSEIVNLKVSDITVDKQNIPFLRIQDTAGDIRYNKLSEDVFSILMEYIQNFNGNSFIISKNGNKAYSQRTLQKYLADACRECEINNYTFNDLRNTGTVYAVSGGAGIELLKKELGMVTNRHITRLESLKVSFSDASNYINVEIKKKLD